MVCDYVYGWTGKKTENRNGHMCINLIINLTDKLGMQKKKEELQIETELGYITYDFFLPSRSCLWGSLLSKLTMDYTLEVEMGHPYPIGNGQVTCQS